MAGSKTESATQEIKNVPEILGSAHIDLSTDVIMACCKGNCPCNSRCDCVSKKPGGCDKSECGCNAKCDCKGHTTITPPNAISLLGADPYDIILKLPLEDIKSMREVFERVRKQLASENN